MKLHSDRYSWHFCRTIGEDHFSIVVSDNETGKEKWFNFSFAHRFEGLTTHMDSLTDDQMKDILKGGKK